MIDLMYVAANRLEMTRESFKALRENTDWSEVAVLFVFDDGSTDGTLEFLADEQASWMHEVRPQFGTDFILFDEPFGGPVAAMNLYLDNISEGVEAFAKIDNDFVVCPGWLGDMLKVMTLHPSLDVLGFEPFMGHPTLPPFPRGISDPAPHVGGKGIIRLRSFSHCRPRPAGLNGYFGWSEFQTKHRDLSKVWVTPDLPCFGLDQLPFEPWITQTQIYVEKKWQRFWPPYDERATDYWQWWIEAREAAEVPT